MASRLLGSLLPALLIMHLLLLYAPGALSVTFTLTNNCDRTVWPGLLSSAGTSPLTTTGFALQKGESRSVDTPANWSGRMWARTLCSADPSTGRFTCATGDCGSGQLECSGGGAAPPATLAEFTLAGADGKDFYDVSLVDGYNLPMLVQPQGGSGDCTTTGCLVDLNGVCPNELKVMAAADGDGGGRPASAAAACKSACEAFGKPEYCCSGEYGNPNTCRPTPYSQLFKNACPRAYSYAYDDGTSTFTCTGADTYVVTFCPSPTAASQKPATEDPKAAALPLVNNTMVYLGGKFVSSASPASVGASVPLCLLAALAVSWKLLQQLF